MKVAFIHARKGSKRIIGKNIKKFCGRPIIEYPIEAAINSGVFDHVVVSTDCDDIARIALNCGAEVPYLRPEQLADDHTPTQEVLKYDIEQLFCDKENGMACCFYATSAFVTPDYIREGLEKLKRMKASCCASIIRSPSVYRAMQLTETGNLSMVWEQNKLVRSQDLSVTYHDAAQFYWVDVSKFRKEPVLFGKNTVAVVLPSYEVHDIDTDEDWALAEFIYASLMNKAGN